MKNKLISTAVGLSMAIVAGVSFPSCAGTDHSSDTKMHEMGGPKPSFPMQDKDMPGRTN